MKKILEKCIELGASSVAMPMIGAGEHGYSNDLVSEIICDEVAQMFTEEGSEFSLNDIRVIIFEENEIQGTKSCSIDSPDKIILHFIGSQQHVDQSFAKVKMFVDTLNEHKNKKQEKEIHRKFYRSLSQTNKRQMTNDKRQMANDKQLETSNKRQTTGNK